jgi:hypothetical protein
MGSNMIGCMYGIMFVQDDNATGFSVEDASVKRKPKYLVKPIDLNKGLPSASDIEELKEQLAALGEARTDNFNEAMDALNELRGGAAVDNAQNVDVFDKSGDSMLRSAGIDPNAGREPAQEVVPAAQ